VSLSGHFSGGRSGTFAYETIMRPANESFDRMIAILLATLLAAGVLGVLVARRQVKPFLKLTEGAKTIATGKYDTRVVATTHDEIGVLANTFNQMAEAMEKEPPNAPRPKRRSPAPTTRWSNG
jgi:nitrogen fixation/metabolism regulation signal transduction histidine kinase